MRDSDPEMEAIADRWTAEYKAQTGRMVYSIRDGAFTYVYDIEGGRVVGAFGRSEQPRGVRDSSRQRGAPAVRDGDHKGHIIAHSMGGGLDINLFAQYGHMNLSRDWRAIEREAARNPGTPVAIRMHYDGDSDRPSTIDYVYTHPDRGPVVARSDNRAGTLIGEQPGVAHRKQRSVSRPRRPVRERDGGRAGEPPQERS
jgi:DNA/RNA non-specific endonuclease